jgi:hypothetical protein
MAVVAVVYVAAWQRTFGRDPAMGLLLLLLPTAMPNAPTRRDTRP